MQLEEQSLTGKATMAEVSELVQVHLLFTVVMYLLLGVTSVI